MRVELRILLRMSRAIRKNKISYERVRSLIIVASIVEKISKYRPRWFGYIMRRKESEPVREVININIKQC